MKIYEIHCAGCLEEITASDIYYEPPEPETGHRDYAETRCCGSQEVLLSRIPDDPEPEQVSIICSEEVWNYLLGDR